MKNIIESKSVIMIMCFLFAIFQGHAQTAGQFSGSEVGIKASNSLVGRAVEGKDNSGSTSSAGVKGISTNGSGVFGESNQGTGVYGESTNYRGVWGSSSNNFGVVGTSSLGAGGYFQSDSLAIQMKGHMNLQSLTNNHDWRFEINSVDGYLLLFYNNVFKGSFNRMNGNYAGISDKRFKSEIATIPDGSLQDILSLRPVSYRMTDQGSNERTFGLIAQEVKEILPELIKENIFEKEKILSISSMELIPLLIKGMQEQQNQIDDLTKVVQDQQAAIALLLEKMGVER